MAYSNLEVQKAHHTLGHLELRLDESFVRNLSTNECTRTPIGEEGEGKRWRDNIIDVWCHEEEMVNQIIDPCGDKQESGELTRQLNRANRVGRDDAQHRG